MVIHNIIYTYFLSNISPRKLSAQAVKIFIKSVICTTKPINLIIRHKFVVYSSEIVFSANNIFSYFLSRIYHAKYSTEKFKQFYRNI